MRSSLLLGALALFTLSACDNVSGQLQIAKTLPVKVNGKSYTIPAGKYDATVEGKANLFKKQIALDIGMSNGTVQVFLNVPNGVTVPQDNGELKLTSAQSGQPFDLDATLHTKIVNSPVRGAVESCTRQEQVERCGPRGCWIETITYYGQQEVRYHFQDTIRDLGAQISSRGSSLAHFTGRRDDQAKIYDYQGFCY